MPSSRSHSKKKKAGSQAAKELPQQPILKLLREKKRVSRTEVSRMTRLSTYQVEGLEGKNAQNLLSKIFLYVNALGYKYEDIFRMMQPARGADDKIGRGMLGKFASEVQFPGGVMFMSYHSDDHWHLGEFHLPVGKSLKREKLPQGDVLFALVRQGVCVLDASPKQSVYKKDQFFLLPDDMPAEFLNGDSFGPAAILFFSFKLPKKSA